MSGHKELLRNLATDILRAERSESGGNNEMGWFQLGIIYASVHFTMSVINKDDKDSSDYLAGLAAGVTRNRKEIVRRCLDYGDRYGEFLDSVSLDQLKAAFTEFRSEVQRLKDKDDEED